MTWQDIGMFGILGIVMIALGWMLTGGSMRRLYRQAIDDTIAENERLKKENTLMWSFIDDMAVSYDPMVVSDAKDVLKKVEEIRKE